MKYPVGAILLGGRLRHPRTKNFLSEAWRGLALVPGVGRSGLFDTWVSDGKRLWESVLRDPTKSQIRFVGEE